MKKLIYILLIVLSFNACREKMDLEFDDSNDVPVLAVEGYVTQGEPTSKVTLRLTSPYFTNQPSPVPNTVAYVLFRRTDTLGIIMIDTLKELVAGSGDYYSKGNYIPIPCIRIPGFRNAREYDFQNDFKKYSFGENPELIVYLGIP